MESLGFTDANYTEWLVELGRQGFYHLFLYIFSYNNYCHVTFCEIESS
jgi:hypothetical protein